MFLPSSTRAPFGGERTIFFTFHMKLLSLLTVYTLFLSERGLFCCVSCSVTRQGVGGASMRNAAERLARREREGTGGREYIDPQVHVFSCNNSEAVVKWITTVLSVAVTLQNPQKEGECISCWGESVGSSWWAGVLLFCSVLVCW